MLLNRKLIIVCWVLCLLHATTTVVLWITRAPQPVLFDTKATVQLFSQQVAKANLSAAEKQALSAQFSQTLEAVINQYSQEHHVILINPITVATPLPDVTQAIQDAVAAQLQVGGISHAKD